MPGWQLKNERRIPVERIRPYLKRYLDTYETNGSHSGHTFQVEDAITGTHAPLSGPLVRLGPSGILAEEVGVDLATMTRWLTGERKSMPFDVADRLLCKMGMPTLWMNELADLYYAVDLSEEAERPLCKCHGEPMNRSGGKRWECRVRSTMRRRIYRERRKGCQSQDTALSPQAA